MSNKDKIIAIQNLLEVLPDGVFGPKIHQDLDNLTIESKSQRMISGKGWDFSVKIEGNDLVIENARVTCFGGSNDSMDSGETASGVSTKPPGTLGCALPRNYTGSSPAQLKALGGSPIPSNLPFKTPVRFTWNGKSITVPFIDIGPAKWTGNEADLSVAAAKQFKATATANNFLIAGVEVRILGGAKYVAM